MLEKSMMFCTIALLLTLVVNMFYDVPNWLYCILLMLYVLCYAINTIYDILND